MKTYIIKLIGEISINAENEEDALNLATSILEGDNPNYALSINAQGNYITIFPTKIDLTTL